MVSWKAPGSILEAPGPDFGASKAGFQRFFRTLTVDRANFLEEDATYEKPPPKKLCFSLQVFCMSAFARTLRKSSENRFECAFRARHATENYRKTIFASFRTPKLCPRTLWITLGGLPGLFWDPPGCQHRLLGALLGVLAASGPLLCALGDASFTKFSKFRLLGQVLLHVGSISKRKPAKFCQKPEILAKT